MKLDYSMNMTQEQRLILTQNMQQSIKLLQMSLHDLREYIDKEYSENPVLEVNEEISSYEDAPNSGEMSTDDKYDYKKMI
jgi:RNA polymerase sigma-54 factor